MIDKRNHSLRQHVLYLLEGGGAHARFDEVIDGIPAKLRGRKPAGLPHSLWMLLEHMRIAQWDILEFSRNPNHVSPKWPEGYWPRTEAPPSAAAWNASIRKFRYDLKTMQNLAKNPKPICLPNWHGATARLSCARPYWWRITMRITSGRLQTTPSAGSVAGEVNLKFAWDSHG